MKKNKKEISKHTKEIVRLEGCYNNNYMYSHSKVPVAQEGHPILSYNEGNFTLAAVR